MLENKEIFDKTEIDNQERLSLLESYLEDFRVTGREFKSEIAAVVNKQFNKSCTYRILHLLPENVISLEVVDDCKVYKDNPRIDPDTAEEWNQDDLTFYMLNLHKEVEESNTNSDFS